MPVQRAVGGAAGVLGQQQQLAKASVIRPACVCRRANVAICSLVPPQPATLGGARFTSAWPFPNSIVSSGKHAACPGTCSRSLVVTNAQSSSWPAASPGPEAPGSGESAWPWVVALVAAAAGGAYMMTEPGQALRIFLVNGPLGRSGFLAAFSLIFVSEIGDKTFFIAALLAMKIGKWMSFFGSVTALSVMTVISVSIGAIFSRVPDALKSSIPVGELAGVALLVFFGIKALRDGLKQDDATSSTSEEELADAESAVKGVVGEGKGHHHKKESAFAIFLEVATLIFLAEWGDRSMLATIALGAAQNPVGVAVGAIAGHTAATGIAVMGGAIASKYVSEKTVNVISGLLFLLFAAATAYQMFVLGG